MKNYIITNEPIVCCAQWEGFECKILMGTTRSLATIKVFKTLPGGDFALSA
ncbi:hypothetical protein [Cyanobacterium sp. uoEpiScrs1]|uniref:hypothetical protein n=1 Tax=Cyanobacterium sp. uoEpiScrs1 TaxID=2976343 RepID=UPI00226A4859|nr:hypothetical protein [Cyanobacterium sp. uoEpiScrs1]